MEYMSEQNKDPNLLQSLHSSGKRQVIYTKNKK